jgi:Dolichyl-phosphate-mannose-protein mannosyltransferase
MTIFNHLQQHPHRYFWLIPLVSLCLHLPIFQRDLAGVHVWRQSLTQTNIQNFHRYDNHILNPRINTFNGGDNILRYEFPIMQWSVAQLYRIFGDPIWVTRAAVFSISVLTLLGVFHLLYYQFSDGLWAWLGTWAFCFSPVFFYYAVNPLPDVLALCMGVWVLVFCSKLLIFNNLLDFIAAVFCLSIATLAKLPYVMFGVALLPFLVKTVRQNQLWRLFTLIVVGGVLFLPPFLWYKWVMPTWKTTGIIAGMLDNQTPVLKLLDYLASNVYRVLPLMLVNWGAMVFFYWGLKSFYRRIRDKKHISPLLSMWILVGLTVILYFLFELNVITSTHDYYMLPFLPPIFVVITEGGKIAWKKWENHPKRVFFAFLSLPIVALLTVGTYWSEDRNEFNTDVFKYRTALRQAVPDTAKCIFLNDESGHIFPYQVNKQGFVFSKDVLPMAWIADMIDNKGATFMYSDSRIIDESLDFQPFIAQRVGEFGSVRVFKLKLSR